MQLCMFQFLLTGIALRPKRFRLEQHSFLGVYQSRIAIVRYASNLNANQVEKALPKSQMLVRLSGR